MDKKSDTVRAYLSQRAELLGAIRLPNNAFKNNAGTEVTSDILFFQKREGISYDTPEWLNLGVNEDGIELNQYFITHPEMILGHMEEISGPYGKETACIPYKDANLKEQLSHAISLIHGQIYVEERPEVMFEEDQKDIPAVPSVKNYSYTIVKDQLYFRENSRMRPVSIPKATEERVRGMIAIRESVRRLIALQMDENGTEEEIKAEQKQLNAIYDEFYNKYGVIGSNGNKRAFSIDASYCLLYLNFNVEPKPTEEELIQMLIQNRNEMEESKEKPESNNSKVPKFGTNKKNTDTKQDEWNLSGSIEQCIIRYASRLNGEQINQILLGLEQGLTDEQVKSYFTLPADKMKQQRNMFRVM